MEENRHKEDPINYNKKGEKRSGFGKFLAGIKHKVAPAVLEKVGLGDIAGAIGIISSDPNNAGISQVEAEQFFRLAEMEMQDLANARAMQQAALQQDDIFSKRFVYYLTIGVVAFVFIMVTMLFFVEIPTENKTIIDMVVGIVIGGYTSVMAFFFGSSRGSKEKQTAIDRLSKK